MNPTPATRARSSARDWAPRLAATACVTVAALTWYAQTAIAAATTGPSATGPSTLLQSAAGVASAAPPRPNDKLNQSTSALSWIQLKDSRGISIWSYELSLDRGGVTSPDKFLWSALTDGYWTAYRGWCALALWFLNWALSFDWLKAIADPMINAGDILHAELMSADLVPFFLTFTAVVGAMWIVVGRAATGVWEFLAPLVILGLASGVFANPVRLVAGEDGLLMQTHATALEVATAIGPGGGAAGSEGLTAQQMRARQSAQLVDTFVRAPTQLINFGVLLDGTKCEAVYDEALKAGPYGDKPDLRVKVGECNPAAKKYADQPTANMAMNAGVFAPAAFVVLALGLVIGGGAITAGCSTAFQGLRSVVSGVLGTLPGAMRGSYFMTIGEAISGLMIVAFSIMFLSLFMQIVQSQLKQDSGQDVMQAFVITDVILVVGVIVYRRQRQRLQTAAERIAQWLSHRPGGSTTRIPQRLGGSHTLGRTAQMIGMSLVVGGLRRRLYHHPRVPRLGGGSRTAPTGGSRTAPGPGSPTSAGYGMWGTPGPTHYDFSNQTHAGHRAGPAAIATGSGEPPEGGQPPTTPQLPPGPSAGGPSHPTGGAAPAGRPGAGGGRRPAPAHPAEHYDFSSQSGSDPRGGGPSGGRAGADGPRALPPGRSTTSSSSATAGAALRERIDARRAVVPGTIVRSRIHPELPPTPRRDSPSRRPSRTAAGLRRTAPQSPRTTRTSGRRAEPTPSRAAATPRPGPGSKPASTAASSPSATGSAHPRRSAAQAAGKPKPPVMGRPEKPATSLSNATRRADPNRTAPRQPTGLPTGSASQSGTARARRRTPS